jgi:two-component system sensor histidine kinase UhpB
VVLQCEDSDLLLRVQDWGRGFDPAALPDEMDRLGLISMHERAHMLGGSFKISSQPGQGTTVSVRVPLSTLLRKTGYA